MKKSLNAIISITIIIMIVVAMSKQNDRILSIYKDVWNPKSPPVKVSVAPVPLDLW